MTDIRIRPFRPEDQDAVRSLILAGLGDHFEVLDPTLNPDLEDIWESYVARGGCFLVAVTGEKLVGTGALIRESASSGRIVRMSVASDQRQRGIGRLLVQELIATGQRAGYTKIVVETNDDWYGAIRLYKGCGFLQYDHRDGEVHMQLQIGDIAEDFQDTP